MNRFMDLYDKCTICPRNCRAERINGKTGFCRATSDMRIARAALHMWEEPCISGGGGSGAIFFSGCNLGCVFCQNYDISHMINTGAVVSEERLIKIFYELEEKGADNINLVTADVYIPSIASAIKKAKDRGFDLPFIFNTSSYLNVESVKMLEGLIDIYLSDAKFYSADKARKYINAENYYEYASAAIKEMHRQTGSCMFDDKGLIKKGTIIRHMLMPGGLLESKLILRKLYEEYMDDVYFSIMSQYTPIAEQLKQYPEIDKTVSEREYDELIEYALSIGIKNAWMQEGGVAKESFIPAFDLRGVYPSDIKNT